MLSWIKRVLGIVRLEEQLLHHIEAEGNTKSLGVDIDGENAMVVVFDMDSMSVRVIRAAFTSKAELDRFAETVRSAYGVPEERVFTHGFKTEDNRWLGRKHHSRGR